ncbi:MAG: sulfur carrier protein ThiS [Flavobacteriales bacterium]|nr:sulfur carrier protein ThiS [Flavobacteriales bacterium]
MITVHVNDTVHSIAVDSSIVDLLSQLEISANGIAIAIDQQIIPQSEWGNYKLQDQQNILLIKATQGG